MGEAMAKLKRRVRGRLTLENDDRVYTPSDLLPFCRRYRIPFVYDVHHHRCLPDRLSIPEATALALRTWNREPLFHISSPKHGWGTPPIRPHGDYIRVRDFPDSWLGLNITVEVEAKAKELAVLRLQKELRGRSAENKAS